MSLQIGDRVYHTGRNANGIIIDVDNTKSIHKYKVEYIWGKYSKKIKHGAWEGFDSEVRKWEYCSGSKLVKTDFPQELNKVTVLGQRSLDKLIQNVCEIPHRVYGDGSDIVISYGHYQYSKKVPSNILVLNRNLICNKYKQCLKLKSLAPISVPYDPNQDRGWIAKPYFSFAGRNIYDIEDDSDFDETTHYAQKKFPKHREFRTYAFLWLDNPVPIIQEKIIKDKSQLCWNEHCGSVFRNVYQDGNVNSEYYDDIIKYFHSTINKLSITALKLLKYDFGGIDFAMDNEGNFKIFEVNSRPGIKERSLFTFKKAFWKLKELDINKYKQERWAV